MLLHGWRLVLECSALLVLVTLIGVYAGGLWAQLRLVARREHRHYEPLPGPRGWPMISVLVPAYNEERVIETTICSLLKADYPKFEIVVIDDGSSDSTAAIVTALADLEPRVRLVRQAQNIGKAHALNIGIAQARSEYLVVVDADTVPQADFLSLIVAPLLAGDADAVAGNVKVGNSRHGGIALVLQSIEYTSVLNAMRLLQGASNTITTIPGAAGAMRRTAIQSIGAYSPSARAEDADLTLRLRDGGYRIRYQRRAIAHTEAPATWRTLFRQRVRWIYGNIQCLERDRTARRLARSGLMCGETLFIYENLCKPPLEFFRAGMPLLLVGSELYGLLMAGYLALLVLNGLAAALSYTIDGEHPRDLLYLPIYYVLWPFFLILPYCAALCHLFRKRDIAWQKIVRTGSVAAITSCSESNPK